MATVAQMVACDYVGIESGNNVANKLEKAGWHTTKSEFVERFPELSLFFKAYSLLDSEMICIFPYFCPYAESAREIREIFS